MEIWLNTNMQAHDFIPKEYWLSNFNFVKEILPSAEIYVYEIDGDIKGFVGIESGYIAGIFVSNETQSKGIGKELLHTIKGIYSELSLAVYKKNARAVNFYQREQFVVKQERTDESTGEVEYFMVWKK
ncbi:MAG: GNAT family N-acetyltransferase [Epulopiscium sp.]|nr:GNAT family N-acetyltransferase [Candidatus Epulonipiscium sp.]